ncbi:MAG: glutathione S-transferase family protein [Gammaproteobacteria bacterium]
MLTIYGHPLSSPTNKVRMGANAAGLEYDFVFIDLAEGEQKSEKYLAINPVGQVPAIDDDGFTLFESNAINKYFARKAQSGLYPNNHRGQALVDQWTDFVTNLVGAGYTRLLFNKIIAPQVGAPVNDNAIREGEEMVSRAFPIVEKQLTRSPFLAGEELTLADIALLATVDPSEVIEMDLAPHPKLNDWREALRKHEFYTRVHNYFGEGVL